jgi:hypothetical protein
MFVCRYNIQRLELPLIPTIYLATAKYRMLVMCNFLRIFMKENSENEFVFARHVYIYVDITFVKDKILM